MKINLKKMTKSDAILLLNKYFGESANTIAIQDDEYTPATLNAYCKMCKTITELKELLEKSKIIVNTDDMDEVKIM